jgi:hypothetical protein
MRRRRRHKAFSLRKETRLLPRAARIQDEGAFLLMFAA